MFSIFKLLQFLLHYRRKANETIITNKKALESGVRSAAVYGLNQRMEPKNYGDSDLKLTCIVLGT